MIRKKLNKNQVIFATQNKNKIIEICDLLNNEFSIVGLNDLNYFDELIESYQTLEENAIQKARFISRLFKENCFADDSGLEVPELNFEPGVLSARYAGPEKNDVENMNKLLEKLKKSTDRKANFKTIIALIFNNKEYVFEGVISGSICLEKRGTNGFGYDPIFVPDGYSKTFAEMDKTEKNSISHRAIAVNKLVNFLNELK